MLVEHVFVTVQPAEAALQAACRFLAGLGFIIEMAGPLQCELRRGRLNPARAKSVGELPQRVLIEFDRGRVTVAASIEEYRKAGPLHRDLLVALAQGLERVLAREECDEVARAAWEDVTSRILVAAARHRRRNVWVAVSVIAVVVLVIVMIVRSL